MTIKKTASLVAASSIIALSLSGFAYADDVNISNTGPGSNNQSTINDNNNFTMTNNNNVTTTNTNVQTAVSGPANVSGNTNGGSAMSGNASNNNTTSTVVAIGNGGAGVLGGSGGASGGSGGASGSGSGSGGASASSTSGSGSGSGGAEVLPATGATNPMDVSALRNALKQAIAPTADAVKQTNNLSTGFLLMAALLSLLGAAGSAVYASKKEKLA